MMPSTFNTTGFETTGYPTWFAKSCPMMTGMAPSMMPGMTGPMMPSPMMDSFMPPSMMSHRGMTTMPFGEMNNYWMSMMNSCSFRPTTELEYYCLTNPVRCFDRDGTRMMWLCFDMRGYKPEECSVTFNKTERCFIIEAGHDLKDKEHCITRKYSRKVFCPEYLAKCDFTKCECKCFFAPTGLLMIEFMLPKMTTEEMTKCTPSMWISPSCPSDCLYMNYFCNPMCRTTFCPVTYKMC